MPTYITIHGPCVVSSEPPAPLGFMLWKLGPVVTKKESVMPVETVLTTEQRIRATVTPTTPAGNPAPLDGPVTYTVESGTCTLEPIDDVSTWIVSSDTPGDSVVLASADADLGDGIEHISDTVLVHVEHAQATSLGLSLGQPELKPTA